MAHLPSPRPSRSDFSGPLRNFLSVRSGGWLRRFEEWMLEVAAARDLEETLSDVEASVGDLISAKEFDSMAAITFEFGESTVRVENIVDMVEVRFFKEGRAKARVRRFLRLKRGMQWFSGTFSPAGSECLRIISFAK